MAAIVRPVGPDSVVECDRCGESAVVSFCGSGDSGVLCLVHALKENRHVDHDQCPGSGVGIVIYTAPGELAAGGMIVHRMTFETDEKHPGATIRIGAEQVFETSVVYLACDGEPMVSIVGEDIVVLHAPMLADAWGVRPHTPLPLCRTVYTLEPITHNPPPPPGMAL